MKTVYKFLIVCSIFLFSFQECDQDDETASLSDCFNRPAANGGVLLLLWNLENGSNLL